MKGINNERNMVKCSIMKFKIVWSKFNKNGSHDQVKQQLINEEHERFKVMM
jgi:hypothetical protein